MRFRYYDDKRGDPFSVECSIEIEGSPEEDDSVYDMVQEIYGCGPTKEGAHADWKKKMGRLEKLAKEAMHTDRENGVVFHLGEDGDYEED